MPKFSSKFWLASAVVVLSGVVACGASNAPSSASSEPSSSGAAAPAQAPPRLAEVAPPADQTGGFDGAKAYEHVSKLVSFGPRPPASDGLHRSQE
ncbi:MAG: hypothetical protein WCF88_20405, partial [Candidatus Acidiferrales bacterium]